MTRSFPQSHQNVDNMQSKMNYVSKLESTFKELLKNYSEEEIKIKFGVKILNLYLLTKANTTDAYRKSA